MVKVRPFRLMLWSLLVITAGGSLIVYGSRMSKRDGASYTQMIEGMADMSQSRASQDNPPVLEIWDMGWLVMTIGVTVAVPGTVLMLGSVGTMLFHKFVPIKEDASPEQSGGDGDGDQLDDDQVGEELLPNGDDIGLGAELMNDAGRDVPPIASATPVAVEEIEPVDLVGEDTGQADVQKGAQAKATQDAGNSQTDSADSVDGDVPAAGGQKQGPVSSGADIYETREEDQADNAGHADDDLGTDDGEIQKRPL